MKMKMKMRERKTKTKAKTKRPRGSRAKTRPGAGAAVKKTPRAARKQSFLPPQDQFDYISKGAVDIIRGGGGIHCITQQQPKV